MSKMVQLWQDLDDLETLEADTLDTEGGIPPKGTGVVTMDASDFQVFEPSYLRAYGTSLRERQRHGTAVARPLVLISARVGNVSMLSQYGDRVDAGLCCHASLLPLNWSAFSGMNGQKLSLTFYNPCEAAVHAKVQILGKPSSPVDPTALPNTQSCTDTGVRTCLIGANSLVEFPDGVPAGEVFVTKVSAGDHGSLTPLYVAAKSYESAYPQTRRPVRLTKGWVGNRPLIADQETGTSEDVMFTGKPTLVDWPSFSCLSREGMDLHLSHYEDKNMHIFLTMLCER